MNGASEGGLVLCAFVCFGVQIRVWFGIFIGFCFLSSGMVLVCFHMMCFVSASYRCNIILKAWFVKHGLCDNVSNCMVVYGSLYSFV